MSCNQEKLKKICPCTFSCVRNGKCCECIDYHLLKNQLPGCAFAKISKQAESTGNRDFEHFAKLVLK